VDYPKKPKLVNVELNDCYVQSVSSKGLAQEYIISLCKFLELERTNDITIQDDVELGFMMYQASAKAYIMAYFMPAQGAVNATIFSLDPLKRSCEEIADYSKSFFMADSVQLNLLQRHKI
jgi:hypothetical protein